MVGFGHLKSTVSAFALVVLGTAPALAQDEDRESSNTIVVTAQFREQALQDTPLAITAVNADMLEARSQITAPWQGMRVGVEAFNDFNYDSGVIAYNEQDHQIGPILKVKAAGFSITASYLMGASDAADQHNFRLHVSRAIP